MVGPVVAGAVVAVDVAGPDVVAADVVGPEVVGPEVVGPVVVEAVVAGDVVAGAVVAGAVEVVGAAAPSGPHATVVPVRNTASETDHACGGQSRRMRLAQGLGLNRMIVGTSVWGVAGVSHRTNPGDYGRGLGRAAKPRLRVAAAPRAGRKVVHGTDDEFPRALYDRPRVSEALSFVPATRGERHVREGV